MADKMILIIGITGASGAIYGVRLLEVLSTMEEVETHLVVSEWGEEIIRHEVGLTLSEVRKLARFSYEVDDMSAAISSGSCKRDGMIVAPCSVKTMSALANSYTENLLIRAGDVTLKERKPLVLLVRETPLHLGHIKNMLHLTEMGAIIMPPMPSLYHKPKTIEDIVNHSVGRVLDLFNIKHSLFSRWTGLDVANTKS